MSTAFETIAQQFVYDQLNGSLSVSVYDDVPRAESGKPLVNLPYVEIGDLELDTWDTDNFQGANVTVPIHVWSRSWGKKEANALMEEVRLFLHRATGVTAEYKIVDCLLMSSSVVTEPDRKTRHGVALFRVTINEIS